MNNPTTTSSISLKRAALWYAAHGFKIFPVAPKAKRPLTTNGFEDASIDAQTVNGWWAKWPDANIGLACAPSGLIALDGDPAHFDADADPFLSHLLDNYPTPGQNTPTLGIHLLYALPEGVTLSNSRGQLPKGIDVRCNGYILLAPSSVEYHGDDANAKGVDDGHVGGYEWMDGFKPTEIEIAPLPAHVLAMLTPKREARRQASPFPTVAVNGTGTQRVPAGANGATNYARAALAKEIDLLARASVGERNNQLNTSAFSLAQLVAGGELPESEVIAQLEATALAIGLEERETERTIASAFRAGGTQPRTAPPPPALLFRNGTHKEASTVTPESTDTPKGPEPADPEKIGMATRIYNEIKAMGYTFRLNEMRDRIEHMDGAPLHDGETATLIANLYDRKLKNKNLIQDVILAEAWQNRYDPLKTFLGNLAWDGKDHIGLLAGWFGCKSEPIHYPDGHYEKTFAVWLRRWLVGAVGKALDGVQNPMLVLAGPQGIGKSEFARWLCSPLSDYFISSPIIPDNVDHLRWLAGNFIWEVAELGATTRKADIEGLKAFLTRPECTYRVPYAKNEVHRPARASFIGTINLDNAGFLMDVTGNRRFLSAEIVSIHWERYTANIDPAQIWAQALVAYQRDPASWKLTDIEEAHRDAINESYGAEDPILDAIEDLFTIRPNADPETETAFVATSEIVRILAAYVHETTTRQLQLGMAKAMRRLHVTKGRKVGSRGERGYFGLTRR